MSYTLNIILLVVVVISWILVLKNPTKFNLLALTTFSISIICTRFFGFNYLAGFVFYSVSLFTIAIHIFYNYSKQKTLPLLIWLIYPLLSLLFKFQTYSYKTFFSIIIILSVCGMLYILVKIKEFKKEVGFVICVTVYELIQLL